MIPGERQRCYTPSCRHTRPRQFSEAVATIAGVMTGFANGGKVLNEPWYCPTCVVRRRKSLAPSATHPSTVRRAQQEGLSVGDFIKMHVTGTKQA